MRHLIVLTALLAVACSGEPDLGPRFDAEPAGSCMEHQERPPGPRYTEPALRRTEDNLALLRYYTENGDKPYCDGKGPTDVDRQWVEVYVRLGADRENVAALLP
jgi:hypothetical protein